MAIVLFYINRNIITAEIIAQILSLKQEIDCGNYSHRSKVNMRTSPVWAAFDEIIDDGGALIPNFVLCKHCDTIKYIKSAATTTQLLRHSCVKDGMLSAECTKIDKTDADNLKKAMAKFVSLDLRPINSVECPGFQELFVECVKLGQKYPAMTKNDVIENIPGRKAVKNMITTDALDSKERIKCLLRKAIDQGGLGCTLDLWTDKYKHNTYMAITANFYEICEKIKHRRFIFYMGNITEIVKTKPLIKAKIVDIFAEFGINEDEIRNYVVFTTDR